MRRILIICLVIFGLVGAGTAALAVFGPEAPEPAPELASPAGASAPTSPDPNWNGAGVQPLNATFLVSGHQIIVRQFSFGGLDQRLAAVEARLLVLPAQPARAAWLQRAFRLNSASRAFNPKLVKVTRSGRGYSVTVRFNGVPSAQLRGGIAFSIGYPAEPTPGERARPTRSISVAPLAPFPPLV